MGCTTMFMLAAMIEGCCHHARRFAEGSESCEIRAAGVGHFLRLMDFVLVDVAVECRQTLSFGREGHWDKG